MITFEVKGMAELDRALKRFPIDMQREAVDKSLKAGGEIVRRHAANAVRSKFQKTPEKYRTGDLVKGITMRKDRSASMPTFNIGVFKRGWYGRLLETGWTPRGPRGHKTITSIYGLSPLKVTTKRTDAKTWRGWRAQRQQGRHKKQGNPWLEPSFTKNQYVIVDAMANELRKYLNTYK